MHSPRDCALAFTFPLDLEEARAQAHDPSHDFIQSFLASGAGTPEDVLWEDYARIAAFSREVLAEAEQRGVLVAADAGLSDWAAPGPANAASARSSRIGINRPLKAASSSPTAGKPAASSSIHFRRVTPESSTWRSAVRSSPGRKSSGRVPGPP